MSQKIELTESERIYLYRKGQRLSQKRMAEQFGVSRVTWLGWEAGEDLVHAQHRFTTLGLAWPPEVFPFDENPHLLYTLLRKRRNISQKSLAKTMGISRYWLMRMETGQAPINRLKAYWEQH